MSQILAVCENRSGMNLMSMSTGSAAKRQKLAILTGFNPAR